MCLSVFTASVEDLLFDDEIRVVSLEAEDDDHGVVSPVADDQEFEELPEDLPLDTSAGGRGDKKLIVDTKESDQGSGTALEQVETKVTSSGEEEVSLQSGKTSSEKQREVRYKF